MVCVIDYELRMDLNGYLARVSHVYYYYLRPVIYREKVNQKPGSFTRFPLSEYMLLACLHCSYEEYYPSLSSIWSQALLCRLTLCPIWWTATFASYTAVAHRLCRCCVPNTSIQRSTIFQPDKPVSPICNARRRVLKAAKVRY